MADPVSLAIQVAITAISMGLQMSKKIEGPRLDNLDVSIGDYNAPLSRVYGKRRVEGCPIIWAETIRVEKQETKTKGGKVSGDIAYATWAVALCYNEIEACPRIWADKHLVLDLTGAGPVTPFAIGHSSPGFKGGSNFTDVNFADHVRIYKGTEIQDIDPRILAWSEEKSGEGSATAYRGMAYVVFEEVPIEKFGNRVPIISAEIITTAISSYPYEIKTPTIDPPNGLDAFNFAWSPDKAYFIWSDGSEGFEMWDTAARAPMLHGFWGTAGYTSSIGMAVSNDSTIWGITVDSNPATTTYLAAFDPDGGGGATAAELFDGGNNFAGADLVICQSQETGAEIIGVVPYSNYEGLAYYNIKTSSLSLDTGPIGWQPRSFFADVDGNVWAVGCVPSTSTLQFERIFGGYGTAPASFTVSGMPSTQGPIGQAGAFHYRDADVDHFVVLWNENDLVTIDLATLAITNTAAVVTAELTSINTYMEIINPGVSTFWIDTVEYSSADLTAVRTLTDIDLTTDWVAGSSVRGTFYDPISHALVSTANVDGTLTWRYLDRVGGEGVPLSAISADVSERAGVTDYDFSDQDDIIVPGWTTAGIGQASNQIEPLFDAYDCDIRLHDFTVEGIKRHGVSGGTLLTERFVAGEDRYTTRLRQSRELPIAISVNFADNNADQQPNNVRCPLPIPAKDAQGEQQLDLGTWAGTADQARALGDRYIRRIWNERREATLSLTAQQLALEPGDVRTLSFDGEEWDARLVKLTIQANGVLATEWKYDDPHLASLGGLTGAEMDGRPETVVVVPLLTKGFVLDVPLLTDADNGTNPVVYLAAAPYAAGAWPGAAFFESIDGSIAEQVGSVGASAMATWGYATEVLPDANPWLWDRGSSVNVMLQVGSLTGTTEAAIDASPLTNMALLGDEILNFATATLEGDGSYTLSGLKRGRRGTEWACATHAARDVFLLLNTADAEELGLSEVGTDLSFKAITSGRTEAGAFPINKAPFTGASLKPYAPCHLEAVKESNGDWTLSWVRRTRVGGAWTSGTSIPLSEASEEYELDLSDGVDTVTKTVTSATTYTWTQAAQIADVGAEVMAGNLDWTVVQISDAVDRGFEAMATA